MAMYSLYQDGQERRRQRRTAAEIAEAMKMEAEPEGPGLATVAPAGQSAQVPAGAAQPQPGLASVLQQPASMGQPMDASGQAAGLQSPEGVSPGLAMVANGAPAAAGGAGEAQPAAGAQRGAQLPRMDDVGRMADSLSRGMRKALELGEPGKAMELMINREKVLGQHRESALGEAMGRFQLTGDPNALIPFVNRYVPTAIELSSITRRPETAGGKPMYVASGIDHSTGQRFDQPFTEHQLQTFISTVGDGAAHKAMFAQQAKNLYDLQLERDKKMAAADAKIYETERTEPIKLRHRLAEIGAQGAETRRTNKERGTIDNRTAAPSEVRTAEWLVSNGVAEDATEAWDLVRGSRKKSREDFALDMAKAIMASQRSEGFGSVKVTPREALQQGRELYDSMQATDDPQTPATQAVSGGDKPFDAKAFLGQFGVGK